MNYVVEVFKTHASAKKAAEMIFNTLSSIGQDVEFTISDMTITTSNSVISFASEDREDCCRGMEFDFAIINESVSNYMMNSVILPSLLSRDGVII